jgi:hypothetical protein
MLAPHADAWAGLATRMRSAVGNDHAGTVYPAATAVAAEMLDIIATRPGRPRRAALDVLLDWWTSVVAEPGYETYLDEAGQTVHVVVAIRTTVLAARPTCCSAWAADHGDLDCRGAAVEPLGYTGNE